MLSAPRRRYSNETQARRPAMMREVTGAFFGSRRLDEALEDLKAEGIAGDRVRVADMSGFNDFHASLARSTGAPTQWITADFAPEFGAFDVQFGLQSPASVEASDDDILPALCHDYGEADEHSHALTRVAVSIRDEAEMRAVCEIFSRLGTDDIDVESAAA
jgi:hypothetical protein